MGTTRARRRLRLGPHGQPAALQRPWFGRLLGGLDRLAAGLHGGRKRYIPHELGARGEEIAYWYLRRQGYTIVARNYRRPPQRGEIDLVAWERQTLVFVEVKTRNEEAEFAAERAVDQDKRSQLVAMARHWRHRHDHQGPFRFDVVTVLAPDAPAPAITLHRDAFRD